MQEIKCPKCGEVFQVDEAGYAAIVKQVRDKEFNKELKEREAQFKIAKEDALEVAKTKAEKDLNQLIAQKDKEIADLQKKHDSESNETKLEIANLNAKIAAAESEKNTALEKAEAEKDRLISELNAKLQAKDEEQKHIVKEAEAEKDKIIAELQNQISNITKDHKHDMEQLKSAKQLEIDALSAQITNNETVKNLAVSEVETKYTKLLAEKKEEILDEEIENLIGEEASRLMQEELISIRERLMLEARVFNSLRKLDALQELLDDPEISEIMVNGPKHIFYEKAGRVHAWNQAFASEEKMQDVIQQIVGRHNRVVNLSNPIVDTRLADGSRVNIVLAPVSLDGSTITIRKFPEKPLDMQTLIQKGALPEDAAEFLKMLVRAKYNLLISGGTSSGKTTFLNALSQYIPEDERVITIEDSAELQIQGIKNLVRLETRNANMEGVQPVTIWDLIRTALRMRPDRILVGECRGAEAFDMLQALNTGHDGGLSTAHGNSSRDILSRLEMMVLMGMELPIAAIRQQIASGIDLIIHLGRLPDKSRRVLEITEVCGVENGEIQISPIYQLEGTEGSWKWKHCGILKNRKKLEMAGLAREKGEIEDGLSCVSSEPEGSL